MSHSTKTTQKELLDTQLHTEDNHKEDSSDKIQSREPVEGTPFTIVSTPSGETLTMGIYALSPTLKTKEEVLSHLLNNEWNIMVNIMHVMLKVHGLISMETIQKIEKQNDKEQ